MDTNRFQDAIARSKGILVVLSREPQFDDVAAALSLYRSLAAFGRKVSIFCPSAMLVEFNRLIGVDQVVDKIGEKNLTIHLRDYQASNIERVSYDIENGEMKLTIIPKEGIESPVKEQVYLSLSGMSADLAILVGVSSQDQLGNAQQEIAKIPNSVSVMLSAKLPGFERRSGVSDIADPNSSSLSETVGLLLLGSNLPVDEDIASNLFMGLTSSTQNFTGSKVRAETFELASKLMRLVRPRVSEQPVREAGEQQISQPRLQNDGGDPKKEPQQDWFKPKIYKGSTMP